MAEQPTLFPNPESADGAKPPADSAGNPFDPTKHQSLADGTPLRKKDGSWVPKGGRPKAPAAPKPEAAPKPSQGDFDPVSESLPPEMPKPPLGNAPGPSPAEGEGMATPPPQTPAGSAQNRATAITLSAMAERLTIGLLGPDLAQTADERDEVVAGWTVWLDSRGGINLSPGWALVACYGGIVASRMERPAVQQRVAGLYHRVRSWLGLGGPK
jgi:hypothetical protein